MSLRPWHTPAAIMGTLSIGESLAKLPSSHWLKVFARFHKLVGQQRDPVMMLLRAHLYTEALMEELIQLGLPKGEVVNKDAKLEYHQKVLLVEALGILDTRLIAALKALNKVRNGFAHDLNKELTSDDVTRIGTSYMKMLQKFRKIDGGSDDKKVLKVLLIYICSRFDEALHHFKSAPSFSAHPRS